MRFWNFVQNADNQDEVELRISGEIVDDEDAWIYEWFGIPTTTPNAFRQALAEYKGKDIIVWIDSWGGSVFAAAGMYNALKEHDGQVLVKVDGKAVSAASVVAMAGEEILMSPVSIMMIHNPLIGMCGQFEASDMRHFAKVLDEVKETIMNAYEIKTKRSRDEISKLMDEETWMSAKKAVAEKFADGVLYQGQNDLEPAVQNSFMFSRLAIQNSVSKSMQRCLEQYKQFKQDGQLSSENEPLKEPEQYNKSPEDKQPKKLELLSLLQRKTQINKNKIRR
ncbi:MAG: Clp protease ClpP [Firmicutes bacterium]|nr:Clp protease ClpP [Bacillota bacterium]